MPKKKKPKRKIIKEVFKTEDAPPFPVYPSSILSLDQFCAWLGISRDYCHTLRSEGRIHFARLGRRKFIDGAEALRFKESLFSQQTR